MCSLTTVKNINRTEILQNKCLRIMNFSAYNSRTSSLYKDDKILKIDELIRLAQTKLVFEFKEEMYQRILKNYSEIIAMNIIGEYDEGWSI